MSSTSAPAKKSFTATERLILNHCSVPHPEDHDAVANEVMHSPLYAKVMDFYVNPSVCDAESYQLARKTIDWMI